MKLQRKVIGVLLLLAAFFPGTAACAEEFDILGFMPAILAPRRNIWRPSPGTSWQWQLTGTLDTSFNVTMYDVDLFETPQAVIDELLLV